MLYVEFVDRLPFDRSTADRRYRDTAAAREEWTAKLDLRRQRIGTGAVASRLHLDRDAGEAEITAQRTRVYGTPHDPMQDELAS